MTTSKLAVYLTTVSLETLLIERDSLLSKMAALQNELGSNVKLDSSGRRMDARIYAVWRSMTCYEVKTLQTQAGMYRDRIAELRREKNIELSGMSDLSDAGFLKKASDLLIELLKDDVEFDEWERAFIRLLRTRVSGLAAGEKL